MSICMILSFASRLDFYILNILINKDDNDIINLSIIIERNIFPIRDSIFLLVPLQESIFLIMPLNALKFEIFWEESAERLNKNSLLYFFEVCNLSIIGRASESLIIL